MKTETTQSQARFWKSVMIFAALFSFIIAVLLIVNYFQINRYDPVNSKVINKLTERLNQNPNDQALRNEIREFDLLARKAYFTNQWQIRFGGYLLLAGILLTIIAALMFDSFTKKINPVHENPENKLLNIQQKARKWISIAGIFIAIVALSLAFLTHKKIGNRDDNSKLTESTVQNEISAKTDSESESELDTISTNNTDSVANSKSFTFFSAEHKSNFSSFRGVGGNGIVYQTNIPTSWDGASGKNILWKAPIPLPGYNSPIIWADKVYVAGANPTRQEVYCYDLNTGKLVWTLKLTNVKGAPAKAPKVTDDTGNSAPTLCTDGEKVYAIFSNGNIVAVDTSGQQVWAKNLGVPENHYGYASSLNLIDNKVIVQFDDKKSSSLMALSTKDGNPIWKTNRDVKISWASPIIVKVENAFEIITSSDPYMIAYNPSNGKELWRIKAVGGEVGPSPAYADGVAFAVNDYSRLVAIKVGALPEVLWESSDFMSDAPSPVATKDYLILVTSYGSVACYNAKTGDLYWDHDFGVGSYSSPILVGDKVYLIDKNGTTHIFKADKTFKLVSEPKIPGKNVCSTPAFVNGKIVIRAGNTMWCVGK